MSSNKPHKQPLFYTPTSPPPDPDASVVDDQNQEELVETEAETAAPSHSPRFLGFPRCASTGLNLPFPTTDERGLGGIGAGGSLTKQHGKCSSSSSTSDVATAVACLAVDVMSKSMMVESTATSSRMATTTQDDLILLSPFQFQLAPPTSPSPSSRFPSAHSLNRRLSNVFRHFRYQIVRTRDAFRSSLNDEYSRCKSESKMSSVRTSATSIPSTLSAIECTAMQKRVIHGANSKHKKPPLKSVVSYD